MAAASASYSSTRRTLGAVPAGDSWAAGTAGGSGKAGGRRRAKHVKAKQRKLRAPADLEPARPRAGEDNAFGLRAGRLQSTRNATLRSGRAMRPGRRDKIQTRCRWRNKLPVRRLPNRTEK